MTKIPASQKKFFFFNSIFIILLLFLMITTLYYGDQYVQEQQIGKGEKYNSFGSKPVENTIKIVFLTIFLLSGFIMFFLLIFNCLIVIASIRKESFPKNSKFY